MSLLDTIKKNKIPQHIAIIMDGNGRWAKAKNLERAEGHRVGVEALRDVIEAATQVGVKYLTVYAFSTENWLRPDDEVKALMELMVYSLAKETETFLKNDIRLEAIGDTKRLPESAQKSLSECMAKTAHGKKLTIVAALSYSSKWELTEAAKEIAREVKSGTLNIEDISENTIDNHLNTKNIPSPDLLIRTGGEIRISNFLLWQAAYSEFYFSDTYWPDFRANELYEAILDFQQRERRFGKTSEQIQSENK